VTRITASKIRSMKYDGEKIPVITAYDYPMAKLADQAGISVILVGDSLGMTVLGYDSTIKVTMNDMVHHVKAVVRGARKSLIVVDMPFMSYGVNSSKTLQNAARLIQEGGAQSVKLEGGENIINDVENIVRAGIPVMGHIGLTPQSVHRFGGYKVQGRSREEVEQLIKDAMMLERAGAYAIVMELIPAPLAKHITGLLSIPTIGIGAGPYCDGQVQVVHDILGFFEEFVPKHTKQYLRLNDLIVGSIKCYIDEVKGGLFPTELESFDMDEQILPDLNNQ
jgi:3-methyl-2-oxobutanoate hydroxymethyltransferase